MKLLQVVTNDCNFATYLSGKEIDERIEDMLHQDFKYETGTETSLQTVKACLKGRMEVILFAQLK